MVRDAQNLARTMLLIPVIRATCNLGLHAWTHWCIIMLLVVAPQAFTKELNASLGGENPPIQVEKGMDMSHEAYRFAAFNCDTPEEVVTQSIPKGCSVEQPTANIQQEYNNSPKQEYTVLQKVSTFEYNATLCTVRRSRNYYDCVWASHVRIAAPPMVYQQVTLRVHECARMATRGEWYDTLSGTLHQLDSRLEVNNIETTVTGDISFSGGHSHCAGVPVTLPGGLVNALFITEDLEVTVRTVTIQETYDTGDLLVIENGVAIPAAYKMELGVVADFGTLTFYRNRVPCPWKRVRDISAIRLPPVGLGGVGLADERQGVHITIHDPVMEPANCPSNYLWTSTGETRIRVVQKIDDLRVGEEDFSTLRPQEVLFAAGVNLKLEYAFFILSKRFRV